MNVASRAIGIRSGEGRSVALLVATMFVSMAGIAIGESGIDALFFDRIGTHALPLMYLAQAASTLVGMLALTTILGRVPHRVIYIWSPVLLALVILAERAVVATQVSWIYPVMWITVAFAMLAQAIGLWGAAGTVVDTHQAKRLFPIFGAGGILGSVVGGLLTRPLVALVGAENLLLAWAGCLAVAFVLCRLVLGPSAAAEGPTRRPRSASALGDLMAGLGYVRRSRLLVAMAAAAVLFSVLFYSLFLPFATVATARFPDADALAGFFGLVWAVITGVAFLISILLTNRLFAWFGVAVMILVLPTLYTGSFGILLVESGFVTLVALRISTGIWLQGVASPAWETLVNVVPDDRRDQVRAFLNGGPAQAGTAIAGVVALVGQDVLSPRAFAAIGLVASMLTLVAASAIRRSYVDALVEALRAGRPQVFDKPTTWTPMPLQVDAEAGRVLGNSMGSDDVRMRRLAYRFAEALVDGPAAVAVIRGVDDPDPIVRLAAVRALDASDPTQRAALQRAIDDEDTEVAAAASARSLGSAVEQAKPRLVQLLGDDDEHVRAVALDQLSGASGEEAADLIEGLLDDRSADVRAAALERLAAAAPERARAPAVRALADADPRVRRAAGRALGSSGEGALVEI
ncbi:MAG: HEAT repeat domain-containing protein, partial [Planctomycetaceae bacterium]